MAALLCGCARPSAHANVGTRAGVDAEIEAIAYRFSLDARLEALEAEVCFRGQPPPELVSGLAGGSAYLVQAWASEGGLRRALPQPDGRIDLTGVARDGCVGYRIDLTLVARRSNLHAVRRGEAVASNVAMWLWRPRRFDLVREASAEFALPPGMRALLPWPERRGRHVLDTSAFAFFGFAAFGRFEVERIEVGAAVLDVAVLEGLTAQTRSHVAPWLGAAARMAAQPFGRFPRERGAIVVVPAASGDPVRFGMVARGGGASLLLLVSPDAARDALVSDWVAVHEFCHLAHPFVVREDAWLSEGLATYYQEVARVRAGVLPEAEAWRRIYDGAQLGDTARGSLAEESARMFVERSFPMVYWAGAAFALLADVELRRRTLGKRSLDDVMAELAACCSHDTHPVPAREVIARMDRIAGVPVFGELMQRWVLGQELPELAALYDQLGLLRGTDGVRIAKRAKDAWIRSAIMAKAPAPAAEPGPKNAAVP